MRRTVPRPSLCAFNFNKCILVFTFQQTKISIIFIFLILIIFSPNTFYAHNSSDSLLSFYPLQIGDQWIYDELSISDNEIETHQWKLEVIKDTLMPNNKVYKMIGNSFSDNFVFERVDTTQFRIYEYNAAMDSTDFEDIKLDFNQNPGDTLQTSFWTIIFEGDSTVEYFGETHLSRTYGHQYGFAGYEDNYIKNIGLYKVTTAGDFFTSESNLKGAVINGEVFGDTTLTAVNESEPGQIKDFNLYQNYPNPFNPATNIRYAIPKSGIVKLKVFDLLGREISTLVNKFQSRGNYKVEFNGSNLSSGVYFYRVKFMDKILTKKFLLLR